MQDSGSGFTRLFLTNLKTFSLPYYFRRKMSTFSSALDFHWSFLHFPSQNTLQISKWGCWLLLFKFSQFWVFFWPRGRQCARQIQNRGNRAMIAKLKGCEVSIHTIPLNKIRKEFYFNLESVFKYLLQPIRLSPEYYFAQRLSKTHAT